MRLKPINKWAVCSLYTLDFCVCPLFCLISFKFPCFSRIKSSWGRERKHSQWNNTGPHWILIFPNDDYKTCTSKWTLKRTFLLKFFISWRYIISYGTTTMRIEIYLEIWKCTFSSPRILNRFFPFYFFICYYSAFILISTNWFRRSYTDSLFVLIFEGEILIIIIRCIS